MSELLSVVRIVLVEPAGALNVGSVARVMKNMGLTQLVLVNPQCDPLGEEARQMAVHATDLLEAATQVQTLPEALQGCQRAIATTARERAADTPLQSPRQGLPWLLETPAPNVLPYPGALIFGPEDRGLNNVELNYAQRFVRIPSNPAYPSLNLAQAVAVCSYELYQLALTASPTGAIAPSVTVSTPLASTPLVEGPNPAALDVLEGYFQQLESLLLKIEYLYPHTASSRMEKFRRLYKRAAPSELEVAMLRGILSQVEWALRSDSASEEKQLPESDS